MPTFSSIANDHIHETNDFYNVKKQTENMIRIDNNILKVCIIHKAKPEGNELDLDTYRCE